ncbi:hypothetical protein ACG0Z6_05540 [Roseateles sp. BYS180W]|uniref:Uncharacterized protein n=1 Tax=Roseateles rivi TaxID=3299028 RepID=A0ABW7FTQ6_9BURK
MLEQRYEKTEAGRQEIRQRQLVASRATRTLLLLITPEKPAAQWLGLVQGAQAQDLAQLLELGLLARQARRSRQGAGPIGSTDSSLPSSQFSSPPSDWADLSRWPHSRLSNTAPLLPDNWAQRPPTATPPKSRYEALYARLTELASKQLGLIKGYRYSLDIERAADIDALLKVAERLVADIEATHGRIRARAVREHLGLSA